LKQACSGRPQHSCRLVVV